MPDALREVLPDTPSKSKRNRLAAIRIRENTNSGENEGMSDPGISYKPGAYMHSNIQ
jgi:hypothetical protein